MSTLRRLALVAAAAVLLPASTAAATERWLAPGGTPNPTCTDPFNPCSNLDFVLDRSSPGDIVNFLPGTYQDGFMGSRTIDVADVTIRGPRWGEIAPGRTGEEAIFPAEPGGAALSVTVPGVSIDGMSFAPGSSYAIFHSEGIELRNSFVAASTFGVLPTGGSPAPSTIEGNVIESEVPVALWSGASAVRDNVLTAVGPSGVGIRVEAGAEAEITGNDLRGEFGVSLADGAAAAEIHGNRFAAGMSLGIFSLAAADVDAEDNWWGCNAGPGDPDCADYAEGSTGGIDADPWLVLDGYAQPDPVTTGGTSELMAWVGRNSDNAETGLGNWPVAEVTFTADRGTIPDPTDTLDQPFAMATWNAPGEPGGVGWTATLDNQTIDRGLSIEAPPVANVQPRSIVFGGQGVGTQSLPQTVEVENTGGSPLQITKLSGKGTGSSLFKVSSDTCTGATVAVGESCTFVVRFAPNGIGSWEPSIEVISNAAKRALRLSGFGAPRVTVGPATLDFRTVPGETGVQDLVLVNNTDDPIDISSWVLRGQGKSLFTVNDISCPLTIAPRGSCTFELQFHPQALNRWDVTMTFAFGPGPMPTVTVPISGDGVRPARVDPRGFDFGEIAVGTSTSQSFTVTNQSTSSLTIGSHKEGAGRSQFWIDPSTCFGAVLAPGGSCSIVVTFHPTTEGSWTPTIVVTTPTRSTTVEVSGSAVD